MVLRLSFSPRSPSLQATLSEQNKNRHYTEAFYEACRRNWDKALAAQNAQKAKRKSQKKASAD